MAKSATAAPWARYKAQPSFVLGFHGCTESTAELVFAGKAQLKPSRNSYDWLGSGIYFWEGSPHRAMEWAECQVERMAKGRGGSKEKPAVVGALIDLGACCNLFDSSSLDEMVASYELLALAHAEAGTPLPKNDGKEPDRLLRHLDCAVIEFMHAVRADQGSQSYDTVRAAFGEGDRLYPGAGLTARNHIQISVRNPACIKGYFRPLTA